MTEIFRKIIKKIYNNNSLSCWQNQTVEVQKLNPNQTNTEIDWGAKIDKKWQNITKKNKNKKNHKHLQMFVGKIER